MGKHTGGGQGVVMVRLLSRLVRVAVGLVGIMSGLAWAASSEAPPVVSESLYRRVLEAGTIPVIVHLRVAALPEGQIGSADGVALQRQAIAAAQSAVLAELAGIDHRVVRAFETIPFLALEVSKGALQTLGRSGLVLGVEEDRLDSPQGGADGPAGGTARQNACEKPKSER